MSHQLPDLSLPLQPQKQSKPDLSPQDHSNSLVPASGLHSTLCSPSLTPVAEGLPNMQLQLCPSLANNPSTPALFEISIPMGVIQECSQSHHHHLPSPLLSAITPHTLRPCPCHFLKICPFVPLHASFRWFRLTVLLSAFSIFATHAYPLKSGSNTTSSDKLYSLPNPQPAPGLSHWLD